MKAQTGILFVTILGSSMVFLDGTVVNVIMPLLQKEFLATSLEIQWVVEAYLLLLSSLILIGGSMGDHYGRRKIFLLGTTIFFISSIGCGLSHSLIQLIIFRSLQGIGGALLTPGSLAIINSHFPKSERGKAIGTWSGFTALMAAFGPVLGGWLSDNASWRWVFFMNVPIGLLILILTSKFVKEEYEKNKCPLDYVGAILVTLGTGFLIYGLIESFILLIVLGFLLLLFFIWFESKKTNPLVPLDFFKSKVFSTINLLSFFLYAALSIVFYFLPFNLIQVQEYSTTKAGAANLPFVLIIFFSSRWSGGLYNKVGARIPITIGSFLCGISFLSLGFLPELNSNYWTNFFPGIALFGIGMSLCISPLTTAVLSSLPEKDSGIVSGLNNSITRIAGLIGIAVMTIVIINFFEHHLIKMNWNREMKNEILSRSKELAGITGFPKEIMTNIKIAYLKSFRDLMIVSSILSFMSGLCAFFLLKESEPKLFNNKISDS